MMQNANDTIYSLEFKDVYDPRLSRTKVADDEWLNSAAHLSVFSHLGQPMYSYSASVLGTLGLLNINEN